MKRLVILGGGESGVGAALLAKKNGYKVFVSDKGIISDKKVNITYDFYNIQFNCDNGSSLLSIPSIYILIQPLGVGVNRGF